MKRKMKWMGLVLLTILIVGCGRGAVETFVDQASSAPPAPAEMVEMEAAMEEGEAGLAFRSDAAYDQTVVNTQDGAQERVIIRTGDVSIVVTDTEEAMNTIAQMVDQNGGWVVSSTVFQYSDEAMTGNMVVRVPSDGFDSFLEAVRRLSVEVTRISTSGQDVTEEYVDLTSRLENLEATAERVRAFLEEAETVEEALEVNRELSRLNEEIELLTGRLQYLEQSAAYSSVAIDLTPDILSQPIEVGGWQPQGVARSALETLVATLQTLADVAIWLVIYVLPIALLIALPVWLLVRYVRRRRAASVAASGNTAQGNGSE
jgi:ABC-type multidrug transport system fused ATPase/permease subunit